MRPHVLRSLAIILTLAANGVAAADSTPLAIDAKICSADAHIELPSKGFPIGCEILDCCPGCPARVRSRSASTLQHQEDRKRAYPLQVYQETP